MAMIPFRDLVAAQLASRHLHTDGWTVQRDLLLDSGTEVHFLASRDQVSLLVYCKEEAGNVLFEHVDHTAALAHEAGADSAILYVPIGSFTPPIILAYAAKQHVRIEAL